MRVWAWLAAILASLPATGLTANEVAELHHAGVAESAIIAALRADGSVFRLPPAKWAALRAEGLGPRLLAAMRATTAPATLPEPRWTPPPAPLVVVVPVTVWVPVRRPAPPPIVTYTIREPRPMFILGPAGSYPAPLREPRAGY